MTAKHRVLVLGAYGNFGARICRAIAADTHIALIVAGRDPHRAAAFAHSIGAPEAVALDLASANFQDTLRALRIDTLIHTAGPFQGQSYAAALAAAAVGANYVDLADGRRFVCDFRAATDAVFERAGRVGICGASTLPALSSAVIDHLCAGWQHIASIDVCIAPAQSAPRGVATLRAVLSYCGAPVAVWREARWQRAVGWADPQPVEVRGLAPRLGAICDVPDLELFPQHYRVSQRVEFRAALEVRATQRVLAWLAALRRWHLLPDPAVFAAPIQRCSTAFDRFGTGRGGMVVRVAGTDASGRARHRSWHIVANDDHGPEIPCMAAIALARAFSRGEGPKPGGYACLGLVPLVEFEPQFRHWNMATEIVDEC